VNEKILFVDDDSNILEGYQRKLEAALPVDVALGPLLGLKCIRENGPYAVVVADMQMPIMNGIQFLAQVKKEAPNTVRMMLTGNADMRTAMDAVNEGEIFRFLTKPCPGDIFGKALVAGIGQYRLIMAEKSLIEDTLNGVVELLVEMMSWVNPEIFGWSLHLREGARCIARHLKIDSGQVELAAMLCRIGEVLFPSGSAGVNIDDPEAEQELQANRIKGVEMASEMLQCIPRLKPVAEIILYIEKNFDGSGFPCDDVAGTDIPIGSRVLKVLIDLAALENRGVARLDALIRMRTQSGKYDLKVLAAAESLRQPTYRALLVNAFSREGENGPTLEVGDVVVYGVRSQDGQLLVRAGERVSAAVLARLVAFGSLSGIEESIEVRRPNTLNHGSEREERL
jgi:response regulator RpfG family c-di-GMP phosphodiesterase